MREIKTARATLVGERNGDVLVVFPPTNFGETKFYANSRQLLKIVHRPAEAAECTAMALSNVEIRAEIAAERLVFQPPINIDDARIGSSSVDLLLHERLIVLDIGEDSGVIVDPSAGGFQVMDFLQNNGSTVLCLKAAHSRWPPISW